MRTPIRTVIAVATVAASLVGPSQASAAEVFRDGDALVIRGLPGEANFLSTSRDAVHYRDTWIQIGDRTGYPLKVDPSLGCDTILSSNNKSAYCPPDGIKTVRLEGADEVDSLTMNPYGYPIPGNAVTLDAGAGDDRIEAPNDAPPLTLRGGEGNDQVQGGTGPDVVDGGPGNDSVDGRAGEDTVLGGPGDDAVRGGSDLVADVIDGGPGWDSNQGDWSSSGALAVSFDGVANDGRPGENDNVLSLEAIKTTAVASLIAGDGADSPVRFEVYRTDAGSSKLVGSRFDDYLRTDHYDDSVDGGAGADTVDSGFGNDTITPGPGADVVYADGGPNSCEFGDCPLPYGNDTINAQDGEKDTIDCSVGTDSVQADAIDVLSGCEVVNGVSNRIPGEPDGKTPDSKQPDGKQPDGKQPDGKQPDGKQPDGKTPTSRCRMPKVKAGTKLAPARKKVAKAGCKAKVKRVKSRRAKGRVVKLTKRGSTVTVHVSRGRR